MPRRAERRRSRLLAGLVVVIAVVGLRPSVASAHAELLSSEPAPADVLDEPPTAVVLRFNEGVEVVDGGIRLFDGAGRSIGIGEPWHPGGDSKMVTVGLPALADGSYVVDWRVVSSDSHALHAAFTFQVGAVSTLDPGVVDRIGQAGRTGRAVAVALGASRAVVIAAMAIVLGGLLALGLRIAPSTTATRRLVPLAALAGGAAGLIALPVQTARVSGTGLSEVFRAGAWTAALDTRAGTAWLVRAVVLVVVGLGASRWAAGTAPGSSGSARSVVLGLAASLLGISSAYGGHGAGGRWAVVGIATTVVHVTAMAIWLGGLVMLLVGLRAATARQVERFSSLALGAVAVVVVSGAVQAVRQVPNLGSVTSSDFGIALVWKLAAVSALLLAAVFSRQLVHGESLGVAVLASRMAPSGAEPVDHVIDLRTLRRSIGVETLIAAGVVVLTSVLMAADPSTAAQPRSFSATLVDREVSASIFVTPGVVGNNEVHLALTSLSGALAQPDDVTLEIADPARGVAGIAVELVDAGGTHLIAPRAEIPYAADWRFTVTARYGFEQYTFVATVPIG